MDLQKLIKLCIKLDREYDHRCAIRELAIMSFLLENGETAIGEIGFQLMIGQPVVSRFISKMEKLGFVYKSEGKAILTDKAFDFFKEFI